jgi:LysR family transcriptional regulator for bpeEF and oprC
MLAQRDQLQDRLSTRKKSVSGIVRISVAALFAEYVVAPQLARLNDIHPELELDLQVSDEMVNLAHAKVDIAIRAGIMPADNMIARKLGHHGRALFAAPGYLKKHGAPNQPDDLKAHRLITNSTTPSHNEWRFLIDGKQHSYTMQGQLRVNNSAAVMSLALAGAGIARVNDVLGRNFVRQGKLKPVLANYCIPGEYPVFAAILAERYRAPKIRATMDYLKGCFAAFTPAPK